MLSRKRQEMLEDMDIAIELCEAERYFNGHTKTLLCKRLLDAHVEGFYHVLDIVERFADSMGVDHRPLPRIRRVKR